MNDDDHHVSNRLRESARFANVRLDAFQMVDGATALVAKVAHAAQGKDSE